MWSLRSLEHSSVIQKLTILEHKNGLVLSNTRVPVSGTWSILFPYYYYYYYYYYHHHYYYIIIIIIISFISGSKNDPKNTKTLKKKIWHFVAEKLWENVLTYFLNFSTKMFRFCSQNGWFYKILEKFLCKSAKTENFCLFVFFCLIIFIHNCFEAFRNIRKINKHYPTNKMWARNASEPN